jgi:hypothetical protein
LHIYSATYREAYDLALSVLNSQRIELNRLVNEVVIVDGFIETLTPDDNYDYQGPTMLIPNPLVLNNGNSVPITFGTTDSDGINANQQVSPDLVDAIKYAIENANNNLSGGDKISSIHISASTNGEHSSTSNHTKNTAVDISRINGNKMMVTGITNQIIELQKAFDNFLYIRENFGPHFKHKYYINSNTWNYNHPIGGHQDHIHIAVRR